MNFLNPITPETISSTLRKTAGLEVPPTAVALQRRRRIWVGYLPDNMLVFIPDRIRTACRLAREAKVLQLLAPRVSFGLPRVLFSDPETGLQVRGAVPGVQMGLGSNLSELAFAKLPQARRLAEDLGKALGELHRALNRNEAEDLGLTEVQPYQLPEAEEIRARLERKPWDPLYVTTLRKLLPLYESMRSCAEIVFTHGDIWGGNLAVNPETGELNGLFDFEDAGLADLHLELMYLQGTSNNGDFVLRWAA